MAYRNKLTDENIQLEEAGLNWRPRQSKFEERFKELMDFKDAFGNCNVPQSSSVQSRDYEYYSLGGLCTSS